ncbi:phage baseplate assembly protein V [bacterium (Candidatus Blackallbacteria) CG13_big_fil_rev_8_21_14_2_50_49_14]|nr:MAG: baseplate protein [bacterium (Candidatus Blackallbacteria) CG18_big_fil_WC_8_21_14_2_50_49_26]PIW46653.1 MAG: phage baseplate assembly protein V [bacterium (Candidatus Blackallbacteria) CG13_big_fil_rev_8_21_14_2_50_49_14]
MNETLKESAVTLRYGLIEEFDEETYQVKVRLPDLDDMLTHWLPLPVSVSQDDKALDTVDIGTQVALLLDTRGEEGIIIGAVYSEEDTPPVKSKDKFHRKFKDGTVIEYDRSEHKLKVDAQGEITIKATGPVTVEGQNVTIKGILVTIDAPLTKVNNILIQGKLILQPQP